MTTTETRPTLPSITCQPWCSDGSGHTDETNAGDQVCSVTSCIVPMSREPESDYWDHMGASYVLAGAFQLPEGSAYIELGWEMDKETDHVGLTVAEARTLAEFIVHMCDAIEAAR